MRDYHLHTRFCRHAAGSPADYARAAVEKGLAEICFTPHVPLPGFRPGFWNDRLRMDEREFDAYLEELEKARAQFPGLTILSGLEADSIPSRESWLSAFLSRYSFDFVLMSIHYVSSWDEDEWVFGFRSHRSLPAVYRDYFREMSAGIDTGLFDCVAHFDLVKQPGKPVLETNREDVEQVLRKCREAGMSVEINTSGERKEIGEAYPAVGILRLMIGQGVPLVTGSDAHNPSQVAFGFAGLAGLAGGLVGYRERRMVRAPFPRARAGAGLG